MNMGCGAIGAKCWKRISERRTYRIGIECGRGRRFERGGEVVRLREVLRIAAGRDRLGMLVRCGRSRCDVFSLVFFKAAALTLVGSIYGNDEPGAVLRCSRLRSEKLGAAVDGSVGERGAFVLEELLCLLPHTGVLPVLQLQEAGQQSVAESLRGFSGKK